MTALVTVNGVTQTRAQWQKDAAISLINNLPATQVAVAIVEFDYYADLVRQLSPVFTDEEGILSAIASVDASGSTYIGKGIDVATQELIGGNHTSGWTQQMIVFSDGYTTGVPADNAAAALTAGVDAVHSVALPGADLTTMLAVALAGHGTLVDATTPTGLAELIDRFAGLGESLVGIDRIDITLPDGTLLQDIASDSLGHFRTPEWLMQPGPNAFLATAYDYAGLSVSAPLTLHGTSAASEPGVLAVRRPGVQ
jgi:hypothetical protein